MGRRDEAANADGMKRLLDLVTASTLIVLCAPLLVMTGFMILVTMGAPILFRQRRTGLNGRLFTLLKFRTMRSAATNERSLATDAARLTTLGRLLRAASLDELPQLWNVVRGDMSLVGPRPLLPEYLDRYSAEQARRHEVKPGITGLAQIKGRNLLSWEDKFALDVWYVDHRSLWLDIKVLARTLVAVISNRDVSARGHATMPEFMGTPQQGSAR